MKKYVEPTFLMKKFEVDVVCTSGGAQDIILNDTDMQDINSWFA